MLMMTQIILVFGMALSPLFSFANAPSLEVTQVTRALINSPQIVLQLQKNNSSHLSDLKITTLGQGVFQYDLIFIRNCECIPSTASVRIFEDLTPTYYDAPALYSSTIKIKTGF
jgi:hypothetical protein